MKNYKNSPQRYRNLPNSAVIANELIKLIDRTGRVPLNEVCRVVEKFGKDSTWTIDDVVAFFQFSPQALFKISGDFLERLPESSSDEEDGRPAHKPSMAAQSGQRKAGGDSCDGCGTSIPTSDELKLESMVADVRDEIRQLSLSRDTLKANLDRIQAEKREMIPPNADERKSPSCDIRYPKSPDRTCKPDVAAKTATQDVVNDGRPKADSISSSSFTAGARSKTVAEDELAKKKAVIMSSSLARKMLTDSQIDKMVIMSPATKPVRAPIRICSSSEASSDEDTSPPQSEDEPTEHYRLASDTVTRPNDDKQAEADRIAAQQETIRTVICQMRHLINDSPFDIPIADIEIEASTSQDPKCILMDSDEEDNVQLNINSNKFMMQANGMDEYFREKERADDEQEGAHDPQKIITKLRSMTSLSESELLAYMEYFRLLNGGSIDHVPTGNVVAAVMVLHDNDSKKQLLSTIVKCLREERATLV